MSKHSTDGGRCPRKPTKESSAKHCCSQKVYSSMCEMVATVQMSAKKTAAQDQQVERGDGHGQMTMLERHPELTAIAFPGPGEEHGGAATQHRGADHGTRARRSRDQGTAGSGKRDTGKPAAQGAAPRTETTARGTRESPQPTARHRGAEQPPPRDGARPRRAGQGIAAVS
jgi:hypothetical protein